MLDSNHKLDYRGCLKVNKNILSTPRKCKCADRTVRDHRLICVYVFRICIKQIHLRRGTDDFSHPLNPYVMNGLCHPYHLGESSFILRGIRSIYSFLIHFSMKFLSANRIATDGLLCLPMSHKKGRHAFMG